MSNQNPSTISENIYSNPGSPRGISKFSGEKIGKNFGGKHMLINVKTPEKYNLTHLEA